MKRLKLDRSMPPEEVLQCAGYEHFRTTGERVVRITVSSLHLWNMARRAAVPIKSENGNHFLTVFLPTGYARVEWDPALDDDTMCMECEP